MIDLATDIVPLINNGFPQVLADATTPLKNITHFPAIILAALIGVVQSRPISNVRAPLIESWAPCVTFFQK